WFRPSDVCVAPDGSVFIADWYDPGVGGHGIGDFTRGRIYRLAPKGNKLSVPRVNVETPNGLLDVLGSPSLAARCTALARIQEIKRRYPDEWAEPLARADKDVVLGLAKTATATGLSFRRARALWEVASLNLNPVRAFHAEPRRALFEASEDSDPQLR